jgi:hypothetical protein
VLTINIDKQNHAAMLMSSRTAEKEDSMSALEAVTQTSCSGKAGHFCAGQPSTAARMLVQRVQNVAFVDGRANCFAQLFVRDTTCKMCPLSPLLGSNILR